MSRDLTPRQIETVEAVIAHGNYKLAGRTLGVGARRVEQIMADVKHRLGVTHTIAACVAWATRSKE